MGVDMKRFVHDYRIVYETLYENDSVIDYGKAVSVAECLARDNEAYRELVKGYFRECGDAPTSDRELAAFAMTAKRYMG